MVAIPAFWLMRGAMCRRRGGGGLLFRAGRRVGRYAALLLIMLPARYTCLPVHPYFFSHLRPPSPLFYRPPERHPSSVPAPPSRGISKTNNLLCKVRPRIVQTTVLVTARSDSQSRQVAYRAYVPLAKGEVLRRLPSSKRSWMYVGHPLASSGSCLPINGFCHVWSDVISRSIEQKDAASSPPHCIHVEPGVGRAG